MQIVIDIPKDLYEDCKRLGDSNDTLFEAIRKGEVLPEGHGELIDRNDLKYERYNSYAYAIANAPTIIEADKEG